MSQHYLNQKLIVSLTKIFLKIGPQTFTHIHPLPTLINNWIHKQTADIRSAKLSLHIIGHKLLLVSHPVGDKRLS